MSDDKEKKPQPQPTKLTALRFAEINSFGQVNKVAFLKMAGGKTIKKSLKGWRTFCKGKFALKNN